MSTTDARATQRTRTRTTPSGSALTRTAPSRSALTRAVPLAALAAALAVAVTHLLFDLAGADFVVAPPGQSEQTVSAVMAAGITATLVLVGGGLVSAAAARWTRRPDRWLLGAVGLALVVMAPNPVASADQALTVVALEVEHLVAAAVALAFLLPPLRARSRA